MSVPQIPIVANELPLASFPVADAAIAELAAKFAPLVITNLEDKAALAAVHSARMVVKNLRVEVEKKRVALKADALAWGRNVDAEAKRLTVLLSPIEERLEAEEWKVAAEKQRLANIAAEEAAARLKVRMDALAAFRAFAAPKSVEAMDDETFRSFLEAAGAKFAAEQKAEADRKAAEAAEAARIAKERAEAQAAQAAEAARLAKEREELRLERLRLDQERVEAEDAARKVRADQEAEAARLEALRVASWPKPIVVTEPPPADYETADQPAGLEDEVVDGEFVVVPELSAGAAEDAAIVQRFLRSVNDLENAANAIRDGRLRERVVNILADCGSSLFSASAIAARSAVAMAGSAG